MDFLSSAGFLFLRCIFGCSYLNPQIYTWLQVCCYLRLVLWTILCEFEEAVNVMGPDCSSWGLPARGTSARNYMNIWGNMNYLFVDRGNMTISRNHGGAFGSTWSLEVTPESSPAK